jgi:hypothetical protein
MDALRAVVALGDEGGTLDGDYAEQLPELVELGWIEPHCSVAALGTDAFAAALAGEIDETALGVRVTAAGLHAAGLRECAACDEYFLIEPEVERLTGEPHTCCDAVCEAAAKRSALIDPDRIDSGILARLAVEAEDVVGSRIDLYELRKVVALLASRRDVMPAFALVVEAVRASLEQDQEVGK